MRLGDQIWRKEKSGRHLSSPLPSLSALLPVNACGSLWMRQRDVVVRKKVVEDLCEMPNMGAERKGRPPSTSYGLLQSWGLKLGGWIWRKEEK